MIEIGKLRQRITIQQLSKSRDTYGATKKGWTSFATCWAAVEPLSGKEFWNAQQIAAEITTRVRIRYREGVKPTMRILFGSRILEIKGITNPEERKKELQILCSEKVA